MRDDVSETAEMVKARHLQYLEWLNESDQQLTLHKVVSEIELVQGYIVPKMRWLVFRQLVLSDVPEELHFGGPRQKLPKLLERYPYFAPQHMNMNTATDDDAEGSDD